VATFSTLQPRKPNPARASIGLKRLKWLTRVACLWHLTSLDAPTVAVVWTLAFAWAAQVHLPLWLSPALALAAWSVYIGDRLLDARNARTPLRERHYFHWRHRRIFVPIALVAAATAVAIFLHFMPVAARGRNSALAAAALLYFGSVHNPWQSALPKIRFHMPKELLVGILFTLACATPTWARSLTPERLELLAPIFAFIALAWLNCEAIEVWESGGTSAQSSRIFPLGVSLAVACVVAAWIPVTLGYPRQAALLAAAASSAALLAWLDDRRRSMSPVGLRAAADLVLLTPLILLVFA
jgi:hypothetical protein